MRALMISWEYPPHVTGGLGTHVAELVAAFDQDMLNESLVVDVLTPRFAGGDVVETINPVVTVYRVDMPLIIKDVYNGIITNNMVFVESANLLLERYQYDLIHIHDWLTGTAGIVLKRQWHLPLIVTLHSTSHGGYATSFTTDLRYQFDQLVQEICDEAEQIIVCSQFMQQEIHSSWGVSLEKIKIIMNGVSIKIENTLPAEERESLRQQYAPADQKLLLFLGGGRISNKKGLVVLIRAMPQILASHPNTRLLVTGENADKLWSLAYELHVEQAIEFLGFISDQQRDYLYQIADAVVIPSLYEPFGIVALEAMAFGCNVIASKVGGLGEIVNHIENGLIVYPNDPQSIVHAVSFLFANPIAAQKWQAHAFDQVNTLYRWKTIAVETTKVYYSVIGRH